ncbi:MAG TPA: hypothetical protein VIN59_06105 [Alphaproteobacteria bacterium]
MKHANILSQLFTQQVEKEPVRPQVWQDRFRNPRIYGAMNAVGQWVVMQNGSITSMDIFRVLRDRDIVATTDRDGIHLNRLYREGGQISGSSDPIFIPYPKRDGDAPYSDAGALAAQWLERHLGEGCRLVCVYKVAEAEQSVSAPQMKARVA